MAIETICQGCGRRLRVPDAHAGRKARCPECRLVYVVPAAESAGIGDQTQPWRPRHDATQWRMRIPDGRVFGPVPKRELDQWLAEGRISEACELQSDASSEWVAASRIYPQLLSSSSATARPGGSDRADDFTADDFFAADQRQSNPYRSPVSVRAQRYLRPHRGGVVLTLGLLGFCCGLLGVFAWVMGRTDLREMREGRMDPSGRGTTQAGQILGIITTLLWAVRVVSSVLEQMF